MKTVPEIEAGALAAIQALRSLAVHGDESAAVALLNVATRGAGHVEALASHPDDRPAPAALARAAAVAHSWPVLVPRIEEKRAPAVAAQLPATFGSGAPIRTAAPRRGRRRDFHPGSRTGFTHGIIANMLADGDFPWGGDPDDLRIACCEKLEADCQGDWENFPWPALLVEEAQREAHRGNPIRHVAERWIKDGLKSLCP